METFPALLALCVWNSPVTGEFPAQRPLTRSFDVFFDLRLKKQFSKQSWGWWFETPSRSLWRQCNVYYTWRATGNSRLLLSPSLVTIALSVGYETWPAIGWHHIFVIGRCKYRLGLPRVTMLCRLTWPIFTVFRANWQSPCTFLTAGKLSPVTAVQSLRKVLWHNPILWMEMACQFRGIICVRIYWWCRVVP